MKYVVWFLYRTIITLIWTIFILAATLLVPVISFWYYLIWELKVDMSFLELDLTVYEPGEVLEYIGFLWTYTYSKKKKIIVDFTYPTESYLIGRPTCEVNLPRSFDMDEEYLIWNVDSDHWSGVEVTLVKRK